MHSIPLRPEEGSPLLDVYEPFGSAFQNAAVLILPGGGYGSLAAHEGEGYAGIFQLKGFKTFVLNYRLGSNGFRHPAMLEDAARALRLIRSRSASDGFDPDRIVVVGSSAGGHLAATLLTQWDVGNRFATDPVERESSRPDLGVLCYPVITMGDFTHPDSRTNLLGKYPTPEEIEALSAEKNVGPDTPPCFVWHTCEDPAVPVENALLFVQALRENNVPFELHIYQDGSHGLGMKDNIPWIEDCFRWLEKRMVL